MLYAPIAATAATPLYRCTNQRYLLVRIYSYVDG